MEQKKTLWIVAAAGIFLLVVVGAALILYSPSVHQTSVQQSSFDPTSGWISSTKQGATPVPEQALAFSSESRAESEGPTPTPSPFTSLETANDSAAKPVQDSASPIHTDKLTVISDNATVYSTGTTTIDLNSLKSSGSASTGIIAKNEITESQINTRREPEPLPPRPAPAPVAENYYTPAPARQSVAPSAPKPAAVASTKASTPTKTTTKASAASTKTKTAAQTKSATATKVASAAKKAPDSFWVQAAAYTSKRNADEARSTLESNKIPSEVFTFTDSTGKTFYRVRVGPYVTKSEAEYWQSRIAMIDKFSSSKSVIVNTAVN